MPSALQLIQTNFGRGGVMSKERALLKECRLIFDTPVNGSTGTNLRNRITELLAQPEQTEPEPVILNAKDTELSIYEVCFSTMIELRDLKQSLFKREPLTDKTIAELWGDKHSGKTRMVRSFARAIEKAHGIGK